MKTNMVDPKVKEVAQSIYSKLVRDINHRLSDYAKCLFHPQQLERFLPHLYRKINGCYQSYSLKFDEIDWDDIYPHLLSYAREADPVAEHREVYITTMAQAHVDLLNHLGDYFVHLTMATQQKYQNILREQAGTWSYKASHAIAPKYPMERPFTEGITQGKMLGRDDADQAMENYFVSQTPYLNALDRAVETEKFTNSFFEQGGW